MQTIVDIDPAARLAEDLAEQLREGEAHIAVSGGSTPRRLFQILAAHYRERIAWDGVTLWQVDERCVPPNHEQSNWRMLHEELLSALPAIRAHRIEAERANAAEDYERLLRECVRKNAHGVPELDIVLLGMGADGHTASLFPGTAALNETERLVVLNAVPQLQTHRVTMTFPLLNAAWSRWFLVTGADKRPAFARAQRGEVPAGRIADATWYVDPSVVSVSP